MIKKTYPGIICIPHSFVSDKACPSFDFLTWYEENFEPDANRLRAHNALPEFKEEWE